MFRSHHVTDVENLHDCFLQGLRRLGGSVGVNYCRCGAPCEGVRDVQAVFVSCPRDAWVREFGEPQGVQRRFDSATGKWIWSWEQQMSDGPARCVGQFFERCPGNDWIIVRQFSVAQTAHRRAPANH
jgi:hypothetical protein